MKKIIDYILWYFPFSFFVFIAIFMSIKFIFIFFFRATFEPGFMFDFTPYYLLTGENNLHLIFLSLILIWFNVYFHLNVSKKNLFYSFIPTGIMLTGLGIKVATLNMIGDSILHYLVFGCLLIIALIDHKHTLMFPDTITVPKREVEKVKLVKEKPIITGAEPHAPVVPVFEKLVHIEGIDEILDLHKQTLFDLRGMLKDDLQRAQKIMNELDRKTRKIDHLAEEMEERRKNLVEEEKLFRSRFIATLKENIYIKPIKSDGGATSENKGDNKTSEQPTMLNDYIGSAAIIKRGILKQVNRPFIELLGYDKETLLQKSLLDFVAPEGISGIEGYYLNKLKGEAVTTYETVLLTIDNKKINVRITIKPTTHAGEKADMVFVRDLKQS